MDFFITGSGDHGRYKQRLFVEGEKITKNSHEKNYRESIIAKGLFCNSPFVLFYLASITE
jgi:hypothetical protein